MVQYDLTLLGLPQGRYEIKANANATNYESSVKSEGVIYDTRVLGTITAASFASGKPRFQYSVDGGNTWINPDFQEVGDYATFTGGQICFKVRCSTNGGHTFVKDSNGVIVWASLTSLEDMVSPLLPADNEYTVETYADTIFVNYADNTTCKIGGVTIPKGQIHSLSTGDEIVATREDLERCGIVVNQEHYQTPIAVGFTYGCCIFVYENREDQSAGDDYLELTIQYD